jgi:H(+)-transporting ATP synthase subunit D
MVLPTTGSEELSPLDQIRQTETNITRQIAATRVSAGRSAEERACRKRPRTNFESEVDAILQLAESELRLTRLAAEIQGTSRRLNALDHLLIPRLEAERDYIQIALDERERTDHFRLKLVKRVLERKRARDIQST